MSLAWIRTALTRNQVQTHPGNPDPSLRGRTYAIPFAKVWQATRAMADGGLRGWTLLEADEDKGILTAESKTLVFRLVDDFKLFMSLDSNGQTRVDLLSASRGEKGDLGRNARRVRSFFRVLDRKIGAGPGFILEPALPHLRNAILVLLLLTGCTSGEETAAGEAAQEGETNTSQRNFQGRSYERHIVFLTARGDSTLLVPWSFSAQTRPGAIDRSIRGWLARSDTWDPFVSEDWESPPSRVPWRILPRGSTRILVGDGEALERIFFEEGPRHLEVVLGDLLVEWTGQRAQTFRVHDGIAILASGQTQGYVLDMSRAWTAEDSPPGDWAFLLSGDSLQLVMEDLSEEGGAGGGAYSGWARVAFTDRQWQDLQLVWSETRAFEPARRDVPMSWQLSSGGQEINGTLTAVNPYLEAGEGEGPMLPVDAIFQVSGTVVLGGRDFPVQGIIRHKQR